MGNKNIIGLQDSTTKRWLQVEMYLALKEENWERLEFLGRRAKDLVKYGDELAEIIKLERTLEQTSKGLEKINKKLKRLSEVTKE